MWKNAVTFFHWPWLSESYPCRPSAWSRCGPFLRKDSKQNQWSSWFRPKVVSACIWNNHRDHCQGHSVQTQAPHRENLPVKSMNFARSRAKAINGHCTETWSGLRTKMLATSFLAKRHRRCLSTRIMAETRIWPQFQVLLCHTLCEATDFFFPNLHLKSPPSLSLSLDTHHRVPTPPSSTSSAETHSQFIWVWTLFSRWQGSNDNSSTNTTHTNELQLARRYSWH